MSCLVSAEKWALCTCRPLLTYLHASITSNAIASPSRSQSSHKISSSTPLTCACTFLTTFSLFSIAIFSRPTKYLTIYHEITSIKSLEVRSLPVFALIGELIGHDVPEYLDHTSIKNSSVKLQRSHGACRASHWYCSQIQRWGCICWRPWSKR